MSTPYAYTLGRAERILLALIFCILAGWEFTKGIWPHRPVEAWPGTIPEAEKTNTPSWIPFEIPSPTLAGKTQNEYAAIGQAGRRFAPSPDPGLVPASVHPHETTAPFQSIDPAEASADQLQSAGFPRHVAANIVKYRAAGGQLRDSTALGRIYGMDQRIWARVKPYIQFPAKANSSPSSGPGKTLDLNMATASDLEALPGIGPGRANAIIKFRTLLGGFHDTAQLRECYTLPSETVDAILPYLVIRSAPSRLSVNRNRLDTLYHPYVNRKILRVLESYKRQHGYFKDPDDLRRAYPPDTAWIGKMLPYLDFSIDETELAESHPSLDR